MASSSLSTMQNPHPGSRLTALAQQMAPSEKRSTINLDKGWKFAQRSGTTEEQKWRETAGFPTDVYSDLLHNSMIPDPFRGTNEKAVQWVAEKTWRYQTTFMTPNAALSARNIVLVFDGLDTFATATLNGKMILQTDNMFIGHEVAVGHLLHRDSTENVLEIEFESPMAKAKAVMAQYPDHKWGTMGGDPIRTAVRKAQYHFGWDWGPRLITCGPWKPIFLEIYESRITDISYEAHLDEGLENVDIDISLEVGGAADSAVFEIAFEGEVVAHIARSIEITTSKISVRLHVPSPNLWWPFTHGSQPLYTATAIISQGGLQLDTRVIRMGIRKIELVQQPLENQDGSSFFFRINNVPVFSSGSCWIPADSLTTRITPQKYNDWVELAKSGNQNMIRVWGGGVFEHEAFYNACDELGVLVWQDFMFACGNYPTHTAMLQSITSEAEQNVKRLRNHPSIVLWAGNNEDYLWVLLGGLEYDKDDKDPQSWLKTTFPARYIYEYLLPQVCQKLIPETPYHPGSPFGGVNAIDPTVGDIHQWGVWHLSQAPYQDFRKMGGRFVSEFGMQALPSQQTVKEYFDSNAPHVPSGEGMKWHNKADGAEDRLKRYLNTNLPAYDEDDLDAQIYHTQLIQAEADGNAFRSWRRDWQGPGKEYCGGALVWQLNDCWPTTSWAIADFYLRPKMAFWAIKRESAPLTIGLYRTSENVEVWAVNMTPTPRRVDILLKMWNINSSEPLSTIHLHKDITLEANQSTELGVTTLPSDSSQEKDIVVAAYILENNAQLARYVDFHEPLKEVSFHAAHPIVSHNISIDDNNKAWLELNSDLPIKGLLATAHGQDAETAQFDDNGVDLVPGETVRLRVAGIKLGNEKQVSLTWLGRSKT